MSRNLDEYHEREQICAVSGDGQADCWERDTIALRKASKRRIVQENRLAVHQFNHLQQVVTDDGQAHRSGEIPKSAIQAAKQAKRAF